MQPVTPASPGASRGHTLIESIVVVAMLAILLTTAVPSLRTFIQRRHLDGASAQLQSDLHFLRSSSVALNQALRITFHNGNAGPCYLIHSGEAAQCSCAIATDGEASGQCSGAELLRAQAWRAGVLSLRPNVTSLRVDPRHGTFSPTGSVDLQAGDGPVLRHVVNILGRVRLCAPGAAINGVSAC